VARAHGAQVWMQINHPGRQMPAALGQPTLAPSAVPLKLGSLSKQFPVPREMSEAEIREVKRRFVVTAQLAERAGFNGVQVHAAHGYLLSQFLSPLSNLRNDRWGGSLENRARLLTEIVDGIRSVLPRDFAVSVKLNSADFQRGGFTLEDAKQVIQVLNTHGVDLLELSGGSYEAPAMQGQARDGRTLAREAYFLEFAREVVAGARMPLMVTGGIRRPAIAEEVLASGVAMVGIGTALSLAPGLPKAWERGETLAPELRPINWRNKTLGSLANMAMVRFQFRRLARGRAPRPGVSALRAFLEEQVMTLLSQIAYRRWIGAKA